ncbi:MULTISPECIES: translesion DNA synthesis-associated protein ImuA [unclassified Thioalkalivibrio]|uniref:translesion DNA synthesis-associated protein ImuA n=1 Tax=unclassified Thioalkalivibrio TaxID=2621013 RepID=UPI00036FF5BF|nr:MULTISPECIES: translesion DNA synthesis-associated protein ImuA [unclassified Thioalkalivibrio]
MPGIDALLDHPALWRGRSAAPAANAPVWPSGHPALDRALGGGWPRGQLIELLGSPFGCGETRLLVPMLEACGREGYWIALLAPPATPWLPGWQPLGIPPERLLLIRTEHNRDTLWAGEQCLRDPAFGVLLAWLGGPVETALLRRLRLAAAESQACAILYRPPRAAEQPSPAHQRLRWQPATDGLELNCLKGIGDWARSGQALHIPVP